eukprot:gnl/MRDRNA2_/MRDRNA2_129299_c0_seq1.p1 gnl/MRDRNA2_/MRDRNA2_129299_c0~~gnl/MRDRNA2_/MRDRNA2_129299_c0_seq1.p1  ORF type:complete len:579 (-),score=73.82 gnl/MRDRNA2_/MRDRNA2_129299_c0_seq1:30-1766(-)
MEGALKSFLKDTLEEYVSGLQNVSSITLAEPIVLKDLALKPDAVNELVEDVGGKCPFSVSSGKIGSLSMKASWLGNLIITATDVELTLGFSAVKAMQCAMAAGEEEPEHEEECQPVCQPVGPPPVAEWCSRHDASEKREKGEPLHRDCKSCGTSITSNYAEWSLCPYCSANQHRCMICGDRSAPSGAGVDPNGNGPPSHQAAQQGPPPPSVWCAAHATSEQRPKIEPQCRPCKSCNAGITTNYQDFALCPHCSAGQHRCLICGDKALEAQHNDSPSKKVAPPCPPEPSTSQRPHVGAPPPPMWCTRHNSSEKRFKGETKTRSCRSCGASETNNYEDFALCQGCSAGQRRCMICADHAAAPASVWCTKHDSSFKRPKVYEPEYKQCRGCNSEVQTNYVEFAFCGSCSAEKGRCMACGEVAHGINPDGNSPNRSAMGSCRDSCASQHGGAFMPSPCRSLGSPAPPLADDILPAQRTPSQFHNEFITDVQPRQSSRPPEPPKQPHRPKPPEYSLLCGLNQEHPHENTPWQPHAPQSASNPSCNSWSQQMAAKFGGGRTGQNGSGKSLLQQFTAKVGSITRL